MPAWEGTLEGFDAEAGFTPEDADRAFSLIVAKEGVPEATNCGWLACGHASRPAYWTRVSLEGATLLSNAETEALPSLTVEYVLDACRLHYVLG